MKDHIYPNAPLVETTFEIRFNGEPAIECNRDKFFNEIRSKYPKVYVPIPKMREPEQPLALIPYRFKSDDEQSGVMVALNSFAFFTRKYEGFALFKNEALRLMNIFVTMFKISKLNRTGLRYIDIIPFVRGKGLIPFQNYLNFHLKLPDVYSKDYTSFSTVFNTLTPTGSITTRIENLVSKDSSQEAILVDFDYAKVDSLDSSELEKYIEESHSYTKNIFESLITDSYRKYMEGGTIE